MLFVGLARAYPEARLEQELNAAGRQAVAAGQADCLLDAVVRNPGLDLRRFVAAAGIDRLLDLQWRNSPLSLAGVPQEPVYAFHGIDDELIPFAPGRALAEHYCAAGVRVLFRGERGGGHFGDGALGAPGAISFLADRFAGKPAPDNCPPGSRKAAVRPACRSTRRIVPIDGRRRSVRVVRKYRMCWSAS